MLINLPEYLQSNAVSRYTVERRINKIVKSTKYCDPVTVERGSMSRETSNIYFMGYATVHAEKTDKKGNYSIKYSLC